MTYNVRLELDETGWWVASVDDLPGCRTQGRSIHQALDRTREAMGLFVDDARAAELVADIRLPAEARRAVGRYTAARRRADREQQGLQEAMRDAVRVLSSETGLSVRDVGELLGVSHQRVHQVSSESRG
jgi:predicted RNase H-like HicB family nuclease